MLQAFAASQKKETRVLNEDSFGIEEGKFYMVADGVSKSRRPDLASEEAVRQFMAYFGARDTEPSPEELNRFLWIARHHVREKSDGSLTTVASAWFDKPNGKIVPFFGFSIGDSRLYLLDTRGRPSFRQISRDHTTREFDVRAMRWRTLLTACCGGHMLSDVNDGIIRGYLDRREWLILATDGVWAYLESNREWLVQAIPAFRDYPQEMLDGLVKRASRVTSDDATIILIMNE